MSRAEDDIEQLRAVLAKCSMATKRLITEDVLALPAIRHMLLVFLKDTSRDFEDWIMDPKCRHRLTQLQERIDSQDVPALTASYEETVAFAAHERLRSSTTVTTPHAFQISVASTDANGGKDSAKMSCAVGGPMDTVADLATVVKDSAKGLTRCASTTLGSDDESWKESGRGDGNADDDAPQVFNRPLVSIEAPGGEDSLYIDDNEEEEAYNLLLVVSEAIKEDAKRKFCRGDFMGAAKTYLSAATALDERKPPPAGRDARTDAICARLADAYVTCMCNAAVSGFKAASAAPTPGLAHSLVVDSCTRALERSGGKCPKARFWRARVKVCQRMYEAAEVDLRKAVEEENETALTLSRQGNGDGKGSRREEEAEGDSGTKIASHRPLPAGSISASDGSVAADAQEVGDSRSDAADLPDYGGHGGRRISSEEGRDRDGGRLSSTEAARWLARVRAKIAQIDAERTKACEQASAREVIAAKEEQKSLERARMRSRYGPGHVPRRPFKEREGDGEKTGLSGGTVYEAGEDSAGNPVGNPGSGVGRSKQDDGDEDDFVWRVPKPPPMKVEGKSPSMIMNDYSMKARFQASPEFELITVARDHTEYVCTIMIGPKDRVKGHGRATNMKAARQEASRMLLKNAAIAWNEENPEDPIDMETMEVAPYTAPNKRMKAQEEITEEFKAYVAAWVDKVVLGEIDEACFSGVLNKQQRKYLHQVVDELESPSVLSKSSTVKGRRRLSVMRRVMMEGQAFMSGDNVVVVDVPEFPMVPADVLDLATIIRPPPKRNLSALTSSALEKLKKK